jgi:hypothetical protein
MQDDRTGAAQKSRLWIGFCLGLAVAIAFGVLLHERGTLVASFYEPGAGREAFIDSHRDRAPADRGDLDGETDDGSGDEVPGMSAFDLGVMYGEDLAADGVRTGSSHCGNEAQVRYGANSADFSQFFRGCMFGVG